MADRIDRPTFDPELIRSSFRDEDARRHFDIGRERAERRLQNVIDKKGCDCPRCLSNEDFRVMYGR